MPADPQLDAMLGQLPASPAYADYGAAILPYLLDGWLGEYRAIRPVCEMVEVDLGFHYLFDVIADCLVAAWGVSAGRHGEPRPAARMAGHPLSNGPVYHRGHAIPHTLGGGTDINLVTQLGAVNVKDFRVLEKRAVATPGAFYFTHWRYAAGDGQTPVGVEQGFLFPGQKADVRDHRN